MCVCVCVWQTKRDVHCRMCNTSFRRECDMKRHKCIEERSKPISEQRGAVMYSSCHRWFQSRGGLAVYVCRPTTPPILGANATSLADTLFPSKGVLWLIYSSSLTGQDRCVCGKDINRELYLHSDSRLTGSTPCLSHLLIATTIGTGDKTNTQSLSHHTLYCVHVSMSGQCPHILQCPYTP